MDVTIRNARGDIVYGAPLVKRVETGYRIQANGETSWGRSTGDAMLSAMQRQIALAVARVVAFRVKPLVVTRVDGTDIRLNHGAPLLSLGDTVMVQGADGIRGIKFRVVNAASGSAAAEVDGDQPELSIAPGAEVQFIENDSDEANARRYRKVRLP